MHFVCCFYLFYMCSRAQFFQGLCLIVCVLLSLAFFLFKSFAFAAYGDAFKLDNKNKIKNPDHRFLKLSGGAKLLFLHHRGGGEMYPRVK